VSTGKLRERTRSAYTRRAWGGTRPWKEGPGSDRCEEHGGRRARGCENGQWETEIGRGVQAHAVRTRQGGRLQHHGLGIARLADCGRLSLFDVPWHLLGTFLLRT